MMGRYKRYLYAQEKVPRCTLLKRKRMATQVCRNRRNRLLYRQQPGDQTDIVRNQELQLNEAAAVIETNEQGLASGSTVEELALVTQVDQSTVTSSSCESNDLYDASNTSDSQPDGNEAPPEHDSASDEEVEAQPVIRQEETICKCTGVTASDVLIMTLSIGLRHNLSWVAQVDILNMINTIYGDEKVPTSKHLFLKQVESNSTSLKYHFFCEKCDRYLGEKESLCMQHINCECGEIIDVKKTQSFFVSLSLEDQLKDLLKDKTVVESLFSYRFNRVKEHSDAIEDIYDGKEYQKHFLDGLLSNPHNFSYSFNTDGMPIGKSSKKTLWPIYITINEFPPKDRDKYVLLAGLYIGSKDPNQTMYLDPFVQQANHLSNEGFTWEHEDSLIHSLFIPLCAVVDSVARFQMLEMSSYTAYYGCTFCYNKSERTRKGLRFTLSCEKPQERTNESTVSDVRKVHDRQNEKKEKDRRYKGVKGPSPLMWLTYFNLITGFVPDYMHAILQGVVRSHMDILFDSTMKKCWKGMTDRIAMDHVINAINERLLRIAPPKIVTRLPRSFHERALWKASEWRAWLFLYCIPCLQGLLKKKYVVHFSMLSTATSILLQKSVSKASIKQAEFLILRYVFLYERYFGKENMVYNIHLLTHITMGVLNWGPLWTHNCFLYEGKNRHMLQMYQSPNQVLKQLARKFLIFGNLPSFIAQRQTPENVVEFCETLLSRKMKKFMDVQGVKLLGNGKWCQLSEQENALLASRNFNVDRTEFFEAFLFKQSRFTTDQCAEGKKSNNSFVALTGNRFAQIQKLFGACDENQVYLIIRGIEINVVAIRDPDIERTFTPILEVREMLNELYIVSPKEIVNICVFMDTPAGVYICTVPHGCWSDC